MYKIKYDNRHRIAIKRRGIMKKFALLCLAFALTACSAHKKTVYQEYVSTESCGTSCQVKLQVRTSACRAPACSEPAPAVYAKTDPCRCVYRPDPCREVLRPRIREAAVEKPRRRCPADSQTVNCGCGYCPTFRQPVVYQQFNAYGRPAAVSDNMPANSHPADRVSTANAGYVIEDYGNIRETVPYMPDAYVLASNRAFSRIIRDMAHIYGSRPGLYIKETRVHDGDLPGGVEAGRENLIRQIKAADTFAAAENPEKADYYLETEVSWFDTPSKTVPAIRYKAVLFDKNNKKLNEWVEVIKKADNSQSWL